MVQYKGGSFLQVGEFKEDELAIYGNLNDLYYIIYVANNTIVNKPDGSQYFEKVTGSFSSKSLDSISLGPWRNQEKKINLEAQNRPVEFMALDINQEGAKDIVLNLKVDQATSEYLKVVY